MRDLFARLTRTARISIITSILVVLALVVGVTSWALTGGLGHKHEDPGHHDHDHQQGLYEFTSVDDVAWVTMSRLYTWNPKEQSSPAGAYAQARDRLAGKMLQASYNSQPAPKEWEQWAADEDYILATAVLVPSSSDTTTDNTAQRLVKVFQKVAHKDSAITPLHEYLVKVELVREGHDWKVSNFNLEKIYY